MFRREKSSAPTIPSLPPRPSKQDLDNPVTHSSRVQDAGGTQQGSNHEAESVPKSKRTVVMGVMQNLNPFKTSSQTTSTVGKSPTDDVPDVGTNPTQNTGMLKGVMKKVNPFKSSSQVPETEGSESAEQHPGMLKGMIQKVNPFKSSQQLPKNEPQDADHQEAREESNDKQKPGMMTSVIQKVNPFKSSQPKDMQPVQCDISSSEGNLADNNNLAEKPKTGMLKEMMHKVIPSKSTSQAAHEETDSVTSLKQDVPPLSCSSESLNAGAVERHSVWYTDDPSNCELKSQPTQQIKKRKTFRIKRILPSGLFGSGAKDSNAMPDTEPLPQVEVQTLEMVEMTALNDGSALDPLEDEDGLLAWWRTVDGWTEWNEATQNDDSEEVVEEAADRVFMAARLFVRLFNQRGASLQQRILELLTLADAADSFHKKTVTASIGGGVASVAGSVTTITGLILAPFTAGTSLIVTAVGIGVATAGGVASASANITDTVHSKTDRKKVEKMIQDYQEEMNDIRECLEFLQEGMETLEEWNFEQYAESISKKHLNQNVKHVMKEGGRAGKALVINTESLISTVQVLSVAGGAAKAAQVMSVTTGVMSGLFLALDVFFLAKDSAELRKGAKTEFAAKIREVCKDLQDGLLELNRIKEELQKTMDGIEVEVEEEDEEILKSDLKKLIELEE
uniref:uncharacterized protein LOC131126399 n=1 Tax=Doryrhamphus excisus TaxID=161450 RepID=UPI0025AEC146|nr:uncharacterized protein LOC131126399 [Doryrhamphus excisus]XP_057924863.1 uncharacterized protein LOC131126399 [Doryrhamphus excisus]XP_057924864.1 uncharacterized protein LOC131126399 [Doryrhamphus excisus]XP_057924865.1 uncharacterized protein LOC131126399 [Doryrhamphus excisus]XP_057924866.1 uncharacterized protein LOC131126399 [Doryrhamphus excisus]XP_057924867.1 uncharacterized protein LOC131126399 [Doryrhamphus excisus]XP_057924868.1 uncharacterized protein LOC131126399 [Doryrhamphus